MTRSMVILVALLFLLSGTGLCDNTVLGMREWSVPMFGTFKVPPEFYAAEIKGLKQLIETQKDNLRLSDKNLNLPPDKMMLLDKLDIALYQLTMNDGQSYRQAWLLAFKDNNPIRPAEDIFNPVTIQQKVQAIMLQDSLNSNLQKLDFFDEKTKTGVKVLEIAPFEFFTLQGKQAYAGGVRILMTYQDMIFPFYARGYAFSLDNRAGAMILVTTDSERQYWNSLMNDVFISLAPAHTRK